MITNELANDSAQNAAMGIEPDQGPVYWAADEGAKVLTVLADKERAYFDFCQRRGYYGIWNVMYQEYYGCTSFAGFDATGVQYDGQEAQLIRFRVAELRSHMRQVHAMTTKTRPAFKGVPTNSDYDSRAQLEPAESGIDYLYKVTYGEAKERLAMEMKDMFATVSTWGQWDPDAGDEVLVQQFGTLPDGSKTPLVGDDGKPLMAKQKTGRTRNDVLLPWEQFCDPTEWDLTKHLWRAAMVRKSKWEVAATYPEKAAYIKSYTAREEPAYQMLFGFDDHMVSTDDVIVKHWYHARSAAMPEGRYICYLGTEVLYDSLAEGVPAEKRGLQSSELPIVPLQASKLVGSALGYSDSWDLAVLQQMLTQVTSDWATSENLFGHPALVMDKGTDIDFDAMVNGAFVLTKPAAASNPAYLTPPTMGDSAFKGIEMLLRFFRELSGLNATMRGDASNDKSGQHAALYHSIFTEFQSDNIAALNMHREAVANMNLDLIKRNAQHPFMIEVVGYDERHHLQAFNSDHWGGIKRVILEATKPVNEQANMALAEFLQKIGAGFETKEQALQFVTEGKINDVMRSTRSKSLHVEWENDELVKGRVTLQKQPRMDPMTGGPAVDPLTGQPIIDEITPEIPVSPTHDPFLHIPEHLALLDGPEFVNNQPLRAAVMAHVLWHLRQYQEMDPELCRVLRIPPPMSMQAAQMQAEVDAKGSPETGKPTGGEAAKSEEIADTTTKLPTPAEPPPSAGVQPTA